MSRLTLPDDANIYGNVHGGTILKLIEESGIILATKFCNSSKIQDFSPTLATLYRIETCHFLKPVKIGHVVTLEAEILFTIDSFLLVEVVVKSENLLKSSKSGEQMTNKARLWYVGTNEQEEPVNIPQIEEGKVESSSLVGEFGSLRNIFQDFDKITKLQHPLQDLFQSTRQPTPHSPSFSQILLSFMVGPNDVFGKICRGGSFLKKIDECAAMVAAKHCQKNVVTACIQATNFYTHIRNGDLLLIHGRATFSSQRSLEIEVLATCQSLFSNDPSLIKAAKAYFTFVSIDSQGKALEVPKLIVENDSDKKLFLEGQERYKKKKGKISSLKASSF